MHILAAIHTYCDSVIHMYIHHSVSGQWKIHTLGPVAFRGAFSYIDLYVHIHRVLCRVAWGCKATTWYSTYIQVLIVLCVIYNYSWYCTVQDSLVMIPPNSLTTFITSWYGRATL